LPTILTIGIFVWGYQFIQNKISIHINRGLVHLILYFQSDSGISKETLTEILVDGTGSVVGFLIALIAVCVVGALLASVVGRTLWRKTGYRFFVCTGREGQDTLLKGCCC